MKSQKDIFAKRAAAEAKLDREVVATGTTVEFTNAGPYKIHLNRIRNEADLVSWIYHLTEKEWLTKDRLRRLLDLVANKKGFDLHCAP